jgi:hypothetical protein
VLRQLIFSALQYNSETAEVTINGEAMSFTRTDSKMSAAGWGANRYVYTLEPPVELAAGTDVQIAATQGQWGLEGVVVRSGALSSPYNLWTDMMGLEGTDADWFSDPDGNGMNNQLDYSLGSVAPVSTMMPIAVTHTMQMVYQRRLDAAARGLDYRMQWTDNLISNVWNTAAGVESGSAVVDASFEVVTNSIPADLPQKFIQLEVEMAE